MSKTPKLRFKEFSGDWESKKLGDLGQSIIGLTYSPDDVVENGTLVLRSSNIKNNKIVYTDNVFVNMDIQEKIITKENDILICSRNGSRALIGKSALIDKSSENNTFGAFMTIFRAEQGKFVFQLLQTQKFFKQIHQNLGATINQITSKDLNSMQFYIPSNEEQEKIASFFSLIDDKISFQGEKVEALKDYKRGMMQKIFSRELRFKDDEGRDYPEWEEKKLGDIANLTSSKRVFASDYVDEGIPFYRGKEITELKQNKKPNDILYITQEKYDDIKNNFGIPVKGDLLLTAVGTLGNSYVIKDDNPFYFKDGNLIWFKDIKEDVNFLNFILTSEKGQKKIIDSAIGSTQKALTIVELNKLKYEFPSLKEQRKIAKFLNGLESKVMKEQEKLDFLNEYKKGLLQQMFV